MSPISMAKMALALAGQFCDVIGSSSSEINSRANNLLHVISIQQGAICNFNNKNLKLSNLILEIFYLNMSFIESKQQ